jgi:uncharacterized membrane protein (UPF0127 family)
MPRMIALIRRCLMTCLLPALLIAITGCGNSADSAPSNLPVTHMRLGNKTFTLEIADKDEDRYRGLMYRDSMPADHGMIFVFPDVIERSFWMKNTRIPLDILYLGADGTVISIHQMQPYVLKGTPSGGAAKYAIELNAGAAADAGVHVGDRLDIPPEAQHAADAR